jgi:hypothetical protein
VAVDCDSGEQAQGIKSPCHLAECIGLYAPIEKRIGVCRRFVERSHNSTRNAMQPADRLWVHDELGCRRRRQQRPRYEQTRDVGACHEQDHHQRTHEQRQRQTRDGSRDSLQGARREHPNKGSEGLVGDVPLAESFVDDAGWRSRRRRDGAPRGRFLFRTPPTLRQGDVSTTMVLSWDLVQPVPRGGNF